MQILRKKWKVDQKEDLLTWMLKGIQRDPNFIFRTEQLTQLNTLKKITLPNGFDQGDKQSMQCNKKKKKNS